MYESLLTSGSFLGVALLIYLVGRLMIGGGRNRVSDVTGRQRPLVLGRLTDAFAGVIPTFRNKREKLKKDLVRAGYYHRKAIDEFLALRNAAMVSWLVFVGAAVVALPPSERAMTPRILIFGGIVLLMIFSIPRLVLGWQATARSQRIQFALPDALDMINMTITGGMPLRRALKHVVQQLRSPCPDIAAELSIVDSQTETGSLEQGLKQFSQRVDITDVTALATIIRHSESLGGNVASAFQDHADSIRRARRQRAEERGNTASIKMLFPIVFFLAPPIYILLLGPAAIELRNFMARETQPGGVLTQSAENLSPSQDRAGTSVGGASIGGTTP